jgi:hypothetical protein
VEDSLTKEIAGSNLPGLSDTPNYNPAKASEVAIRSSAGWRAILKVRRQSEDALKCVGKSDDKDRRILAVCSEDIASLWNDASVRQALGDRDVALQEQPGLCVRFAAFFLLRNSHVRLVSWKMSIVLLVKIICQRQASLVSSADGVKRYLIFVICRGYSTCESAHNWSRRTSDKCGIKCEVIIPVGFSPPDTIFSNRERERMDRL